MKVGTKSLLFGAHQFLLHPIFVTLAWKKLYKKWPNKMERGCVLIHDWGYYSKPNMDGAEGETHPEWAANWALQHMDSHTDKVMDGYMCLHKYRNRPPWCSLLLFHSRFYAKKFKNKPSKLCWADKLGTAMYPVWLWVLLCKLTGELDEYMTAMKHREDMGPVEENPFKYFRAYREKVKRMIREETGIDLILWGF